MQIAKCTSCNFIKPLGARVGGKVGGLAAGALLGAKVAKSNPLAFLACVVGGALLGHQLIDESDLLRSCPTCASALRVFDAIV